MKKVVVTAFALLIFNTLPAQKILKDTLYFDFGSSEINSSSGECMNKIKNAVLASQDYKINLFGHTDSVGGVDYNIDLGEERAKTVMDYLISKGLDKSKFVIQSYGKSKPVVPNKNDELRWKNRRVEILCTLQSKINIVEYKEDTVSKKPIKPFENDTVIYGNKGTEMHIKAKTFYPKKIKEIKIDVKEVLTRGDMLVNDLPTVDNYGNCLRSGGMVFITATLNGEPIQPQNDSAILIKIPADSIDPDMKIYEINDDTSGDSRNWVETKMKLTYDTTGKQYYEISTTQLSGFNIDKIPGVNPVKGVLALFKESGLVVKSRKYAYRKSYFTSQTNLTLIKGKKIKPKKVRFRLCSYNEKDLFVGIFKEDTQYYLVEKPLQSLRYSRFYGRFVIRKKDYIPMSKEQLDDHLSKL